MKKIKTRNAKGGGPALEPIRFEFTHPAASTVCVAGTFNGWHPEATPMVPSGDGHWLKELVLTCGTNEYCLVVDGKWLADSLARKMIPDLLGGRNSALKLSSAPEGQPANLKTITRGGKAVDYKTQINL